MSHKYISISEAARSFKISREDIRLHTESGYLPSYYAINNPRRYAELIDPVWSGDSLGFCTGIVLDKNGEPCSKSSEVVYLAIDKLSYSLVLIKPEELNFVLKFKNDNVFKDMYSIKEAAECLQMSVEEIFGILSDKGQPLTTIIDLRLPTKAVQVLDDDDCSFLSISGKYEIDFSSLVFKDNGLATLLKKVLRKNGCNFKLLYESNITKSDIYITGKSMIRYMINSGYKHPVLTSDNNDLTHLSPENIKEFVVNQRLNNVSDEKIAQHLLKTKNLKGKLLSKEAIGRVMHPNPSAIGDKSAFTHFVSKLLKKS